MRGFRRIAVLGLALTLTINRASAEAIYAESRAVPYGVNVHSTLSPDIDDECSGSGQIVLRTTPPSDAESGSLAVWCLDLFHTHYTAATFTVGSLADNGDGTPLTSSKKDQITALAQHGDTILSGGSPLTPGHSKAEVNSAIQIAIWSIENDPTYRFVSDDGALNNPGGLISAYVANVSGTRPAWKPIPFSGIVTIAEPGGQTLGFAAVPKPASLEVLVTGILGIGLARQRAPRRNAAEFCASDGGLDSVFSTRGV